MEDIIKSLKEFIWDIIGYLIPGFLLIIVFNLIFLPSIAISKDFLFDWNQFAPSLIVVLAYCLGYVVYSLTILKIKLQDTVISWFKNKVFASCHSKYWAAEFLESPTVNAAKTFLKNNGYEARHIEQMSLSELRNILMSRDPSMDQKVYTFMFRSSMFDHISTISILILVTVIAQILYASFSDLKFIKTESPFNVFYVILIIIIPLLGKCKRIFYSIAKRLPFSNLK